MTRIAPDSHVTLHYRMAVLADGEERELVNTFGAAPATLQMGVGQWAKTLEDRLLGLVEGQCLDVSVPAPQAYGAHNPELVRRLGREQLPARAPESGAYTVGESVELTADGAPPLRGVLQGWEDGRAVVDFNHPLAGRPLLLRVRVIGVL